MMGLGYKQSHKELVHPKHLHALRRADEDLGDVVIIGAILTFGFGTFSWLLLEGAPPEFLEHYSERDNYMSFLYPVLIQFLLSVLFIWFLDTSKAWPRFGIILLAALIGVTALFGRVLGGEAPWEVAANSFTVLYSAAVIWVAVVQIVSHDKTADQPSR